MIGASLPAVRLRRGTSGRNGHVSERVEVGFDRASPGIDYFDGIVIGAGAIGERALDPATARSAEAIIERLEPDDHATYSRDFAAAGRRLCGESWRYADIVTVLHAAADLLKPSSYLEIGVRRGRSMAVVASRAPRCSIIGVDLWQPGYADMENPGAEFVRGELDKDGFEGELELLSGNSHRVLPRLFRDQPELSFDLITVDGDHSRRGARRDLTDLLPRLRIGGVLVFDDTRHPLHPELHEVWERAVVRERRYASWEFDEIGYGVALAVRRW